MKGGGAFVPLCLDDKYVNPLFWGRLCEHASPSNEAADWIRSWISALLFDLGPNKCTRRFSLTLVSPQALVPVRPSAALIHAIHFAVP